jgi:hypothetical protein
MKYVSVTSPGSDMSKPIFNYFENYLVSLGEPATSNAWTLQQLDKHASRLLKEKPADTNLYIDSGGFQIIVGYITSSRVREYVDSYHFILEKYRENIGSIFSLDVFNSKYSKEKIYEENKYSIEESISLIKKFPEIADKQLFVMQTSNAMSFDIWKNLFIDLEVYKYYKKWSIGGLVGLKKSTNARFSHAVPATLWLLTYQKHFNFSIDQIHWLGQSSRLSFLSMALFERLYSINMTSDSSQLVRFAPIEQKFPLMYKHENEFCLIETVSDVFSRMLKGREVNHEIIDYKKCKSEIQTSHEYYVKNDDRFHNVDFIEIQSQNVYYEIEFGNLIADKIMEIGIDSITEEQQLRDLHPILNRGRTALELMNNINFFKEFQSVVSSGDITAANTIMERVTNDYKIYFDGKSE